MKWSLPPSVASVMSDVKLPAIKAGTPIELVRLWKYTFCRDCLEPLLHRVFAVDRPSFKVTMELDKKLRTHPMPQALQYRGINPVDTKPENSELTMQRIFLTNVKQSGTGSQSVCKMEADAEWVSHSITPSCLV
jgi:hypothetical protein